MRSSVDLHDSGHCQQPSEQETQWERWMYWSASVMAMFGLVVGLLALAVHSK